MKDAEDEAFDELAKRQGMWGGGFHAKRAAAADKAQDESDMLTIAYLDGYERGKRAVLAQPAQEHVAVVEFEPVIQGHEVWFPARCIASKIPTGTKLYTTPPKREWVGLTDEEQMALLKDSDGKTRHWLVWEVEAKLKEKNT